MKELPSVSAFNIDKKLNNYQETFHSKGFERTSKKVNVVEKINEIFASTSHVYKSRVRITLKDDIIEKNIIGKTQSELLTLSGEKIKIIDIIDIEKI